MVQSGFIHRANILRKKGSMAIAFAVAARRQTINLQNKHEAEESPNNNDA